MSEKKSVEISTGIVIRTILILLGLWLIYLVRDVLALFFISVILAATLDPLVDWMGRKKIPRPLGTFAIYIVVASIVAATVYFLVPSLIDQFNEVNETLPLYAEKTDRMLYGLEEYAKARGFQFSAQNFINDGFLNIFNSSGELFLTTLSIFNFFISIVVVLSLTFYMLVKEEGMKKFIITITPKKHQDYAVSFFNRIHNKIGRWVFGQLILMFVMFVMSFAVLASFDVPFALLIALVAGFLEIIPYIGPIISAAIATLVGFLVSPVTGLIMLASFTVLQQFEGHIVVPQVMRKAVGLNPVVVILVLLVGAKLGGIMGTILSIPLATAAGMFIGDVMEKREI
ncbi:MAG: hypothetical protein ACD_11C00005G0002 [uncultured bacterium]|nr:MAG: hypothetical protein ACD_11C00005G0002 [uncultured bacterium]